MTIDIAHPPLTGAQAEALLDDSLRMVNGSPLLRVLKVIHGYGSSGKGGSLRTVVGNWSYRNRNKIRASIAGESFSPFDGEAQHLGAECGTSVLSDIGPANRGMTIVWVK